ncbi:MAG TPA: hypothetical protein VK752_11055 [Bryobacteraceae bacterium]|nr:hypothetical protein [Bryobacteraceae bacterium]
MKLLGLILLGSFLLPGAEKLEIEKFALRQFEDGPALPASHEFLPGETIYWSFRVKGFHVTKTENDVGDPESHMKLTWTVRATDPKDVLLEKERGGKVEARVFDQDKDWTPRAADSFVVPPFAPYGTYHATVTVKDETGEASATLDFKVRGDKIEPSDTLIGRDVRFLRSENDPIPLHNPGYEAGDTLWVRFDITGYKFGEKNKYDVEYGLAILRANGETMFTQPVAAKETNESFYPQHYVPGILSLGLNKDLPKGSYIMVITMRDKIGNQTWEAREKFQVQ